MIIIHLLNGFCVRKRELHIKSIGMRSNSAMLAQEWSRTVESRMRIIQILKIEITINKKMMIHVHLMIKQW